MSTPFEIVGGIPVFRPSLEEFKDFKQYMKTINRYGMQSGIAKVIPPLEWVQSLPEVSTDKLQSIKIRNPIVQNINGGNGVYAQQNIEKRRTFNIVQWKALSQQSNYQPPAPRGKKRNNVDSVTEKKNKKILANKDYNDKAMFSDFEFNIDTSEFTDERCEQLEKVYWKGLLYSEPMYGADMLGSIFDDTVTSWNVARLPNVLDQMEEKLPGVNDAYLYAGLWKATFSWHLEDQDLYSINYLHFGAPKQWYSIPQDYKDRFDTVMRETFPQEYASCPDFLRHKTFLVSPQVLESKGVKVNKIIHHEREFMITYPFGYHAGFNYGYNLAESVNFAIEEWFEFGLKTTKCLCINDSVGINVKKLICKVRGESYIESSHEISSDSEMSSSIEETPAGYDKTEISLEKNVSRKNGGRSKRGYDASSVSSLSAQRKKRRLSSAMKPLKEKGPQCLLCPHQLSKKQLLYSDFQLIPTSAFVSGGRESYCHRICATLIPEVKIRSHLNKTFVDNLADIPNARKRLKCVFCHENHGACFQCSNPKCTKSFHATCALPAGVYFVSEEEYYCRVHRKSIQPPKSYIKTIGKNDLVQLKINDFFAGIVLSNNSSEETLTIKPYPLTDSAIIMEVRYSAVFPQGLRFTKGVTENKKQPLPPKSLSESDFEMLSLKGSKGCSFSIEEFEGKKWVVEKVTLEDSESDGFSDCNTIWFYKPTKSSDTVARYSDDYSNDNSTLTVNKLDKQLKRTKLRKSPVQYPDNKSESPAPHPNEDLTIPSSSSPLLAIPQQNSVPLPYVLPAHHFRVNPQVPIHPYRQPHSAHPASMSQGVPIFPRLMPLRPHIHPQNMTIYHGSPGHIHYINQPANDSSSPEHLIGPN